jgi:hypothetical protein
MLRERRSRRQCFPYRYLAQFRSSKPKSNRQKTTLLQLLSGFD